MLLKNESVESHTSRLWTVSVMVAALVFVTVVAAVSLVPRAVAQEKTAVSQASEVTPASDPPATKEGSTAESMSASSHDVAAEANMDQANAIAEIEKTGGKLTVDEKTPGKPVISVDFGGNNVTNAELAYLQGMTELKSLNLMGTKITDVGLARLKGLTKLQSLNLAGTEVEDEGLGHLKGSLQLQSLNVQRTQITDAGLVCLEGLTNLQDLNLHNTRVTNAGLAHLQGMTQLKSLDLWHTHVTDAGLDRLKGLRQLQSLNLMHTEVTDRGLANVKGLTRLQMLDLSATGVTDAGLANLERLANLHSLSLRYNRVSDAGLAYVKGLTQLQSLWLGETQVTDAGLACLKGLTELQTLDLAETQIADPGLADLKGLTKLQWLDLCKTKITDAGIAHLEGLTKLRGLYLVNTKLTDAGLEHLKSLTQLRWLYLGATQVTDAGVKKLQQVLPTCKIDRTILDENTPPSITPSPEKTSDSAHAVAAPAVPGAIDQPSKGSAAKPANQKSGGDGKATTDLPKGAIPTAKTADDASPGNEKWRKELAEAGIRMPLDYIPLPAYRKLDWSDVRRHFGITAAQEKKLREIAVAFQAEQSNLSQAYEQWQGLPPQERKSTKQEWHARFEQTRNAYRKPIEDVLTAEQRAAYQQAIRGESAWNLCLGSSLGKLLGIELSERQQQQGKRLLEEHRESDGKKRKGVEEAALAVLTPQQRQRLLARFSDAEVVGPFVHVMPATQQVAAREEKPSLNFRFISGSNTMVTVYPALTDPAAALTAEQEAKLRAVQAKAQAEARKLFERYEVKAAANELLAAAKTRQAEYRRKLDDYRRELEQFGKDVIWQIDAVLQPQQAAVLRAIARNEKASWTLINRDRAALDDIQATAGQRAKWRQIAEDYESHEMPMPNMPVPAAVGERAVAILTPEQRKKLDEGIERNGW